MDKFFNIPLRYRLYSEEKRKEEMIPVTIAQNIISKLISPKTISIEEYMNMLPPEMKEVK